MPAPYKSKIRDIPVDDPDKLMRQYKATGDVELRNQLVMHYLQRVNIAIYSMRSILLSNIPFEDFFDQGVIALIDCIERYDPDRGASFDTYSYTAVRGAILKYLRKQNWLSNRVWEARKRIKSASKELEQTLMREPTGQELSEHLGISEKELSKLVVEMSAADTVSFEKLVEQTYGGGVEEYNLSSDEEIDQRLMDRELRDVLIRAVEKLPPKEKQVIALSFYENLNLKEISLVLDVTPQRVSQIRKKALNLLAAELQKYENGES